MEMQASAEKVILILRAHPFTQIYWLFNSLFIILFLIILDLIFPTFLSLRQMIFINIFVFLLVLSYVWFNFLKWYFNVGILTNQRVIDIDFENVIYREITEVKLDKITDVTSKSGGVFESFFDYGDVFVQTPGTEQNIEFLNIPNPSDVIRMIDDLAGK